MKLDPSETIRYEGLAYNRPVGRGLLLEGDRYPDELVPDTAYYRVKIEITPVETAVAEAVLFPELAAKRRAKK